MEIADCASSTSAGQVNQENDRPCLDLLRMNPMKSYEEISTASSYKRRKLVSEVWKDLHKVSEKEVDFVFDQERSSLDVTRMIIKHGYTLNMGEHEFFKIFVNNLQPMFKLPSQVTIRANVLHVCKEEKEKLFRYLNTLSCRFSFIINFRTCHLKRTVYCCLSLQFIDGLELKKKKILALNCDSKTPFEKVRSLFQGWKIKNKVCSITFTNESSSINDEMLRKLKVWLSGYGSLGTDSNHIFNISCCMQVLKILVRDGLHEIGKMLNGIINDIEQIEVSQVLKEKFRDAVNEVKVLLGKMSSPIELDSAFLMLEIAVMELSQVFLIVRQIDPNMGKAYKCLVVFNDVVDSLSGSKNLTANVYFPKICKIHWILLECMHNLKKKFDEYLKECSLALAIAVVFDPRLKFQFVEYVYGKLYGQDNAMIYLQDIRTALEDLYNGYENAVGNGKRKFLESFRNRNANSFPVKKEELKRYLEEPSISMDVEIDILGWWHTNTHNFPTLSRMARDILAIPMSAAVTNSVLSPVFDGLNSEITEALICGEDWLEEPQSLVPLNSSSQKDMSDSESYTSSF